MSLNTCHLQVAALHILFCILQISFAAYCPPVSPPCVCITTIMEPVSIRCNGAESLTQVVKSLTSAKNALKIDSLYINSTAVHILPPRAFQGFTITRLTLRKSNLSDLDEMAFDGQLMESLQELDLTDNNLTSVPKKAVSALKNLRKLSLSKNQIDTLSSGSFQEYESKKTLVSLDVSYNRLSYVQDAAFVHFINLQEIDMQHNLLKDIPYGSLRPLKDTLKNLNLALNKVTNLAPFGLDLPKLESLSLEYNELTDAAPEAFQGLPSLLYLYLTGNKLARWEAEMFRSMRNLRNLGIGGTGITDVPWNAFQHLPKLMRLEMSDGVVETLDSRAFRGCRYIQAIILNNNKLSEIKPDTFQGLADLYTLDLSRNNIRSLPDGAFSYLPGLRHLDLSGNDMQAIEPGTFDHTFMPSSDSKVLYLCGNPWHCDSKFDPFRRWLRDNIEMVIDKPECTAVCKSPDWLANWPVRFPNPPPPPTPPPTQSPQGLQAFLPGVEKIQPFPQRETWLPPYANFLDTSGLASSANAENGFYEPQALQSPQKNITIPSFAQILFGRVPDSIRSVFEKKPLRKEKKAIDDGFVV